MAESIVCPKCGKRIELTEAFSSQIEEKLRTEFEIEANKQQKAFDAILADRDRSAEERLLKEREAAEKLAKKRAQEAVSLELQDLKEQLKEKARMIAAAEQNELALRKKERELAERERTQELASENLRMEFEAEARRRQETFDGILAERNQEAETRILREREAAEKSAQSKAKETVSLELRDLQEQLDEKSKLLKNAELNELALRKKERELTERERTQQLEFERQIAERQKEIWDQARSALAEESHLKDLDNNKRFTDMKRQIEELKIKAEQGSQQAQGEALELELEDLLRSRFPHDAIEPIAKGVRGGDILQKIHGNNGSSCGQILWEFKRTKTWNDAWIQKLKDDQRTAGADVGVIVSTTLPKEAQRFSQIDGVWVTDTQCLLGLAIALRNGLIQLAEARTALIGKSDKMEMMYSYLSGPEFRRRIEAIMESFVSMKHDLDAERRAMEKMWAKRDKQIQRVLQNTGGMYGDVQGIVGAALPEINLLELPSADSDEEQKN